MSAQRAVGHAARRWLLRSLLAIAVLFAVLWLVAASGLGMGAVVPWALARAVPEGWTVRVGSAEGDWRRLVRIRDLTLEGPDATLTADAFALEFRLLPLLGRTLEVRSLVVSKPELEGVLSDGADSVPPPDTVAERSVVDRLLAGSPLGDWRLHIAELRVEDAGAVLSGPDGVYRVERADLAGTTTLAPDVTSISIDSLVVEAVPPRPAATPGDGPASAGDSGDAVRLHLAADFEDGALDVHTLQLRSERSDVDGAGRLLLAPVDGLVEGVDFRLHADPLDLRDLPVELPPALADQPLVRMQLTAAGPPEAVTVALESDGPGSAAARADGIVRFDRDQSRWRAEPVEDVALHVDTRITVDLAEWATTPYAGDLTADLEIAWSQLHARAPLRAEGTLVHSPPDDAPAGLLGGPLRMDVDVSRSIASDAAPAGRDTTAAPQVELTAVLHRPPVPPSSIDVVPADREWEEIGEVGAQIEGTRAQWQIDLLLDSSSVRGSGAAAWGEGARGVVVDELRTRRLDLSAVVADLPVTSIDGLLAAEVSGGSLSDLAGRVALALGASAVGETVIDTASVQADLVAGSITGTALVESSAGDVEADYHVLLGDSLVEATVSRLEGTAPDRAAADSTSPSAPALVRVADAALAADSAIDDTVGDQAAGDTDAEADSAAAPAWMVRGRAAGSWALRGARRGTLEATLDTSSVGGFVLTDARVESRLLGDSLTASARADVEALLAAPAEVWLTAEGRGTSLDDAMGFVRLRAARYHLAEDSTRSGATDSVAVEITAAEPGRLVLDGDFLPAEGGRVLLGGRADVLGDTLSFALDAHGTLDTPMEILSGGTVQRVALESSGVRTTAGWDRFAADVLFTDGRWREVVADTLRANLRYDATGVRLDTLALRSNVLEVAGSGFLPASATDGESIGLTARFDLEPLRGRTESELPTVGGNTIVATIAGTTDSVEVAVSSSMTALVQRDVRVSGFEGEASGLFRPPFRDLAGLVTGRARIQLDRISLPDSDIGNLVVAFDGTPEEVRMEVRALVDEGRTGEMDARIDPTPDGRSMQMDRLQLHLDEDQWALTQPAVLSFRDGVALRGFELRAGEQAIRIDGGLTASGALDLALEMDSTDVATVADLVGFPRLGGWLGGDVRLGGTRDAPEGSVDLILGYHEEGEPPTSARILLESDGRRVDTDVALADPNGGTLTLAGLVPIHEEEAVDLRVDASAFSIGSAVAFIDTEQLEELAGRIDAALAVTGPRDDLRFDGSLGLSGGRARSPLIGVTWEDIRVAARGDGRSLLIDAANVEAGSGSATFSGSIAADTTLVLDIDAAFDDFSAIQTNAYQASISGDLHLGGTPFAPEVAGRVTTESLDVYIDERPTDGGVEDVALTPADFEILRERFGYVVVEEDVRPTTSELLTADVTVEFGRDSWIRSRSTPEMAVAFTGDVEVRIRPGAEPQLQGTLTTIADRGYIAQFGKRFAPREGTVTLDGPPSEAVLDLSATYTVPSYANPDGAEATIVLGVTGTQEELSLTLSSEPPMENADIVSYIATGRPAASTFALGDAGAETGEPDAPGGGLAETGAGIAVGQILSSIETAAQTGVGLDVVEIRREGIRGATLAAGKYVSPRLYLGFAQPILRREREGPGLGDHPGSEIEIEFLTFKNILLNLEGSASALSAFLRGRIVY